MKPTIQNQMEEFKILVVMTLIVYDLYDFTMYGWNLQVCLRFMTQHLCKNKCIVESFHLARGCAAYYT